MVKKDKKTAEKRAVERRLEKLILECERLAQVYVLMVYNGGRVDSVKSADEFCKQITEACKKAEAAAVAIHEHYQRGCFHGYLVESLREYVRRACRRNPVVC